MLNFQKVRTRPRVFQQLTGLTLAAFETLLADFERAYDDDRQQRDRQRPTPRRRRPGGGAQGALPTPADKLVFLLFYFRQYPTQETLAFLFGFSQGQACQWIHRLTPIVNRALGYERSRAWEREARKIYDRGGSGENKKSERDSGLASNS